MAVSWIQHRFAGGALALDTANTVVLRGDPERNFDRFEDRAEIARFAEAASMFRSEELGGRRLKVDDAEKIAPVVLEIREATDRLFRDAVPAGAFNTGHLSVFLKACSKGFTASAERLGGAERPFGDPATPLAFEAALAVSATSLLGGDTRRLRICGNCRWLFLDRSRNSSRLWCDMAVCGNRRKASRHYQRRKAVREVSRD